MNKLIKEILKNMVIFACFIIALFTLCLAILFPLAYGSDGFPGWLAWVIYPLALIIISSINPIINLLSQKTK